MFPLQAQKPVESYQDIRQRVALEQSLTKEVNLLLSMLGASLPATIRPNVLLRERDTASTDGQHFIWLPPEHLGRSLLASGFDRTRSALLAHEISHWLQPLDAVIQVEKETGLNHDFANVVLDIQGEALVETLVPNYKKHLTALRRQTAQVYRDEYLAGMQKTFTDGDFFGLVMSLSLLARYVLHPSTSFLPLDFWGKPDYESLHKMLGNASPFRKQDKRIEELFARLTEAGFLSSAQLPDFLREIAKDYPELCTPEASPVKIPLGDGTAFEGLGKDLLAPFQHLRPSPPPISFNEGPLAGYKAPSNQEQARANAMKLHFATPRGGIEIMAPGRFDRMEALRGSPMPWTMTLTDQQAAKPMPDVFVAVDISGSMSGEQWRMALSAARSITLAVQAEGGDVRGLIFNHFAWHAKGFDPMVFFADAVAGLPLDEASGGTSFAWLPLVWQDFPYHRVVVLTDGDSGFHGIHHIPDRRRKETAAVVIPPGSPDNMLTVAANAVEVADLRLLAGAMTSVLPRRTM